MSTAIAHKSKALEVPSEVLSLLEEYVVVFEEPKGLTLCRGHEHQIILKPGTQPTYQKPYRYPYYQKLKLKTLFRAYLSLVQLGIDKVPLLHLCY